jgi:hypothetical protein
MIPRTQNHSLLLRIVLGGTVTMTVSLTGCFTGVEGGLRQKMTHGVTVYIAVVTVAMVVAVATVEVLCEDTTPINIIFFLYCI